MFGGVGGAGLGFPNLGGSTDAPAPCARDSNRRPKARNAERRGLDNRSSPQAVRECITRCDAFTATHYRRTTGLFDRGRFRRFRIFGDEVQLESAATRASLEKSSGAVRAWRVYRPWGWAGFAGCAGFAPWGGFARL